MGRVIRSSYFSLENLAGLSKPIIHCCSCEELQERAISINMALAKKLEKLSLNRRTMQLEKCFTQIISELPDNVVIKDIDVMFNPAYKVDILRLLISAYKKKSFSVIWPGTYNDGKLLYAEEGCLDYKVYSISDYDVTCIV